MKSLLICIEHEKLIFNFISSQAGLVIVLLALDVLYIVQKSFK